MSLTLSSSHSSEPSIHEFEQHNFYFILFILSSCKYRGTKLQCCCCSAGHQPTPTQLHPSSAEPQTIIKGTLKRDLPASYFICKAPPGLMVWWETEICSGWVAPCVCLSGLFTTACAVHAFSYKYCSYEAVVWSSAPPPVLTAQGEVMAGRRICWWLCYDSVTVCLQASAHEQHGTRVMLTLMTYYSRFCWQKILWKLWANDVISSDEDMWS